MIAGPFLWLQLYVYAQQNLKTASRLLPTFSRRMIQACTNIRRQSRDVQSRWLAHLARKHGAGTKKSLLNHCSFPLQVQISVHHSSSQICVFECHVHCNNDALFLFVFVCHQSADHEKWVGPFIHHHVVSVHDRLTPPSALAVCPFFYCRKSCICVQHPIWECCILGDANLMCCPSRYLIVCRLLGRSCGSYFPSGERPFSCSDVSTLNQVLKS